MLKGRVVGKHTHSLHLAYVDGYGKKVYQKAYVKNGCFVFKGYISSPVYASILYDKKIDPNRGPDVSNFVEIFLSPGNMTMSLKENDFANAEITGSPVQDEWINLQKDYIPINTLRDSLYDQMFKLERAGNTSKNHIAHGVMVAKLDRCELEINKINYHYIETHARSYLSAYLLQNYLGTDMPLDSVEMFYKPFSNDVKRSVSGKFINKVILNRSKSVVGNVLQTPAANYSNGSKLDLDAFKNKGYIILYFWADWGHEFKQLKQSYNKYHLKGLEIVTVSIDPFKKMWRDTIRKNGIMMWHNTILAPVANLDTFFNIRMMAPSLILLVDKNKKIIGRYRGKAPNWFKLDYDEGTFDDLDKKLAEVFTNNK